MDPNRLVAEIIHGQGESPAFTVLEVGALPIGGQGERFHSILDHYPGSRIIAFEVDQALCEDLNNKAREGLVYYPVALGRAEETRPFYITTYPMCCSLYKPNEKVLNLYHELHYMELKETSSIDTMSLDYFLKENSIGPVDFIKIDVQGAELDVFQGGVKTLAETIMIISEVEFVDLYEKQPLFGDVSAFLKEHDLAFHRFLNIGARGLKPSGVLSNSNYVASTHHLWADAIFLRNLTVLHKMDSPQLLKLGVLAYMYDSPDVAIACFSEYDARAATDIAAQVSAIGVEGKSS